MPITVTTWNINSVRLRINLVAKFLKAERPDVLCLQETKCPDDKFPLKRFARLGYTHVALNGQKGYHGVAVVSRVPFDAIDVRNFCDKIDCRHVAVTFGEKAGLREPTVLHNFYVPAGGDEPDPEINVKFAHKLAFLDELRGRSELHPGAKDRAILVGDLNVAPLETDVWSHKQLLRVVSHTPIEVAKLGRFQASAHFIDAVRAFIPPEERLYSWWSYRARDWRLSDRGRRLDHIWVTPPLRGRLTHATVHRDVRGWDLASDHVPVVVRFDG